MIHYCYLCNKYRYIGETLKVRNYRYVGAKTLPLNKNVPSYLDAQTPKTFAGSEIPFRSDHAFLTYVQKYHFFLYSYTRDIYVEGGASPKHKSVSIPN